MENWFDLEQIDTLKYARSIERDCQEAVKWERRKLEWILEEEKQNQRGKEQRASEAA